MKTTDESAAHPYKARLLVFIVDYEPLKSGLAEDEAMMDAFGMSGEVRLRSGSSLTYRAGEYTSVEGLNEEAWRGIVAVSRATQIPSWTTDAAGINRWQGTVAGPSGFERAVPFLYLPARHLFATVERSGFEASKAASFARNVARTGTHQYRLQLKIDNKRLTITQFIQSLDTVKQIKVQFRHSQSPGHLDIDEEIDETAASWMTISATGKPVVGLDKAELVDSAPSTFLAKALFHVAINVKNGIASVLGFAGAESKKFTTKKGAEQEQITVPADPAEAAVELARQVGIEPASPAREEDP